MEIAQSATEAEIISFAMVLKTTIPLIEITKELKVHGESMFPTTPTVCCTAFEDNSGAFELATTHKYQPQTVQIFTKMN